MSFLEMDGDSNTSFKEFGLLTFNTYANKFEDGRLSNKPKSIYRPFFGDFKDDLLELMHIDRISSKIDESYKWQLENDTLTVEKWELLNDKTVKVMEGVLSLR